MQAYLPRGLHSAMAVDEEFVSGLPPRDASRGTIGWWRGRGRGADNMAAPGRRVCRGEVRRREEGGGERIPCGVH